MTEPIELELMDWKEMEEASITSIRTGRKMVVAATTTLEFAEKMIKASGAETDRGRISRIKKSTKDEITKKQEELHKEAAAEVKKD